jgi:hypothetical protein
MKKNLLYLFLVLFLFAYPALAQTNTATNAPVTLKGELAHAQQLVATNASQIMVEILTGVKNEGSKIYTGTKEALGQAYETVKKETPEVIREFMLWRAVHHGIWMGTFIALASIAFYWSRRFKKLAADCPPPVETGGYYNRYDDHGKMTFQFIQYILVAVTSLILLFGVFNNLYPMLKIAVAPRVYIIEYVVDTVQSYNQPRQVR